MRICLGGFMPGRMLMGNDGDRVSTVLARTSACFGGTLGLGSDFISFSFCSRTLFGDVFGSCSILLFGDGSGI